MLFEYVESELEIRVESIKNTIDDQYKTLINNLEQVKHSFLERKNELNEPKWKKMKKDRSSNESCNRRYYRHRRYDNIGRSSIGKIKLSYHYFCHDTVCSETESLSAEDQLDSHSEVSDS